MAKRTLIEEATALTWGPTVDAPKDELEAVAYALDCLGGRARLCSLGEVYAIKSLLWLKERLEGLTHVGVLPQDVKGGDDHGEGAINS